jgi:hypothetical protein
VLEGPEGAELKGGIKDLIDSINHAFLDQFRGEEGKHKMQVFITALSKGLHELAQGVEKAEPFIRLATKIGQNIAVGGVWMLAAGLNAVGKAAEFVGRVKEEVGGFIQEILDLLGLGDDTSGAGEELGGNLGDGFVNGIRGKIADVIGAAAAMGEGALDTIKGILGIASPSKEFAWMGDMSAEGFADGMASSDAPEGAAADMGNRALGAAGGSPGGGGGAAQYIFAPQINLPPGSTTEHAAAVNNALQAAYPEFLAMVRRAQREGVIRS